MGFLKKKILLKIFKFPSYGFFCIAGNISWRFGVNCLRDVGGDRFLVKWSEVAVLVCASHWEPIVLSGFDLLCLEDCFEFFWAVRSVWWLNELCKRWVEEKGKCFAPPPM